MNYFKDKVVYQIYPRSFNDSDNDGFGDIKGITEKLDYLKTLGVDYLWICPFFVSPQNDNGYDVADYRNIDPAFGTMEDLEELIAEGAKRNIDLMLDMVFNHCSTEHEWFKRAMAGEEKYKNYFYFKKPVNGGMPTNWVSKFGGPVWEYVPEFDEYYLHLFDPTQADLNWFNEDVQNEMCDILNFWINKGVRGFRFDVVNLISKPETWENDYEGDGRRFYTDGPRMHEYLKLMNSKAFGNGDFITVGEMSSTSIENCRKYSGEAEKELSMVFNFHHLKVDYKNKEKWTVMPFDFQELKQLFVKWQLGMQENKAWNALFWNCHDQPRSLSRFGDDKNYPKESGKMLATTIHMMQGTPYIYQGEEIGMTNAYFTDISQYRDVESMNYFEIMKSEGKTEEEIYQILADKSRDNARTPMQWNADINAGFSTATPWIGVNPNYTTVNVESALEDKESIFYHYQKLIQLRKTHKAISEGEYVPMLMEHDSVYAYRRVHDEEEILVLNNFYGKKTTVELEDIEGYEVLISNYPNKDIQKTMELDPYESIAYIRK